MISEKNLNGILEKLNKRGVLDIDLGEVSIDVPDLIVAIDNLSDAIKDGCDVIANALKESK